MNEGRHRAAAPARRAPRAQSSLGALWIALASAVLLAGTIASGVALRSSDDVVADLTAAGPVADDGAVPVDRGVDRRVPAAAHAARVELARSGPTVGARVAVAKPEAVVPKRQLPQELVTGIQVRRLTAAEKLRLAVEAEPTRVPSFAVASFNILGSQHTRGRSGYAAGTTRAYTATQLITGRGISVVGFSELQGDQLGVFTRNAPSYAVYPGAAQGNPGIPTSLAWDTRVWTFVEGHTFDIPFSGQIRPAPSVLLRRNDTGAEVWFVNIHNSPQGMEASRQQAMGIEVAEINRLTQTGKPVVMTGDFNEKAEALCTFTQGTELVSAVGGAGCVAPRGARVDWIFVSPQFTVESYVADRSAPIPSITDHAVMVSRISIP